MVKFTKETFEIDGVRIDVNRVEPRRRECGVRKERDGSPKIVDDERARFEVLLDGVQVAWAVKPFGVGKQAHFIERLGEANIGRLRGVVVYPKRHSNSELHTTRDVAGKVLELRRSKSWAGMTELMTQAELAVYAEHLAAEAEREKAEAKARRRQSRLDQAEAERKKDEYHETIIDGLRSIRDRFSQTLRDADGNEVRLSNAQINAIELALERFVADDSHVRSMRAYWAEGRKADEEEDDD